MLKSKGKTQVVVDEEYSFSPKIKDLPKGMYQKREKPAVVAKEPFSFKPVINKHVAKISHEYHKNCVSSVKEVKG